LHLAVRGLVTRPISLVLLLVALTALAVGGSARAASAAPAPVRVMPLGDSITHGYNVSGGYRVALEDALAAGGLPVDFVGSESDGPSGLGDRDHEGHPGWRIDDIAGRADGWIRTHEPEVVLLMIGTNDVIQNRDLGAAPQRLDALIDQIATAAPASRILVASLTPLSRADREERVQAYNAAIPGIVAAKAARGMAVSFVDMHSALSASSDLADGVHPNAEGYAKMASVWIAALQPVLAAPPQSQLAPVDPAPAPVTTPATTPASQAAPVPPVTEPLAEGRRLRLVRISSARLRSDRRGRVRVRISCRKGGPSVCSGILRLRTASPERADRAHLASRRFRVRSDRRAVVRMSLDRLEQRRLRRRSSTRVSLETVVRIGGRRHIARTSTRLVAR
jgi:lysophospholipase L1-like esterase